MTADDYSCPRPAQAENLWRDGMSIAQIAKTMGVGVDCVKQYLADVRGFNQEASNQRKIRELLAENRRLKQRLAAVGLPA